MAPSSPSDGQQHHTLNKPKAKGHDSYDLRHWNATHKLKSGVAAPKHPIGHDGHMEDHKYPGLFDDDADDGGIALDMDIHRHLEEAGRNPFTTVPVEHDSSPARTAQNDNENHPPAVDTFGYNDLDDVLEALNIMESLVQPPPPGPIAAADDDDEDSSSLDNPKTAFESPTSSIADMDFTMPHSNPHLDNTSFLQVPMPQAPTSSTYTTATYALALQNRIKAHKLLPGADYDIHKYTPTFIHDILQLPGSLANVLGKLSSANIANRLTSALLPGFKAHIHPETNEPMLLQSPEEGVYTQGILLFGQGRTTRDKLHAHYRPHCRRIKVQVDVDLLQAPLHSQSPPPAQQDGTVFRKKIWANAWIWANAADAHVEEPGWFDNEGSRGTDRTWTLEEYLAGTLGTRGGLYRDGKMGYSVDGWGSDREGRTRFGQGWNGTEGSGTGGWRDEVAGDWEGGMRGDVVDGNEDAGNASGNVGGGGEDYLL